MILYDWARRSDMFHTWCAAPKWSEKVLLHTVALKEEELGVGSMVKINRSDPTFKDGNKEKRGVSVGPWCHTRVSAPTPNNTFNSGLDSWEGRRFLANPHVRKSKYSDFISLFFPRASGLTVKEDLKAEEWGINKVLFMKTRRKALRKLRGGGVQKQISK